MLIYFLCKYIFLVLMYILCTKYFFVNLKNTPYFIVHECHYIHNDKNQFPTILNQSKISPEAGVRIKTIFLSKVNPRMSSRSTHGFLHFQYQMRYEMWNNGLENNFYSFPLSVVTANLNDKVHYLIVDSRESIWIKLCLDLMEKINEISWWTVFVLYLIFESPPILSITDLYKQGTRGQKEFEPRQQHICKRQTLRIKDDQMQ